MNKSIIQESGYRISVTSWENDGDNYNNKSITVDSAEDARVLVALCKLLSRSGSPNFGNMYGPNKHELAAFADATAAIPGIKDFLHKTFPGMEQDIQNPEYGADYMDSIMDVLYDLGLSGGEHFFTRVCDTLEVHYFAEPVYADNLTLEFV